MSIGINLNDEDELPEQGIGIGSSFREMKTLDLTPPQVFLIWSEEHGGWWRPHERGYTTSIREAGRYPEMTARRIVGQANYGPFFNEIAIPVPEGLPA